MQNAMTRGRVVQLVVLAGLLLVPGLARARCCPCFCTNDQQIIQQIGCGDFSPEQCDAACIANGLGPAGGMVLCSRGDCSSLMDCPTSEAGFCQDGIDNDGDGRADAADLDCLRSVPAMGHSGLLFQVLLLGGVAAAALSGRRWLARR